MAKQRKRMQRGERKELILKAAERIFAEKGYRMTSVTDIVEASDIGRGTFYLYFSSKKDIFLELIEFYFERFASILRENHRELEKVIRSGGNVLESWRKNVERILGFHSENPYLTSIVYQEALGRDEDFALRVDELSKLAKKLYLEEFRLMAKHNLIRPCDLELVISIVTGSTITVIMEHLLRKKRANVRALARELVEYHSRALAP